MKHGRIYNFSSGPVMMPDAVLEEIQDELLNYRGTGMCVMEMSHRSEDYRSIARQTEADLRQLLSIPDEYRVLFIQGGGTLEFSMVPLNLRRTGKCVYIDIMIRHLTYRITFCLKQYFKYIFNFIQTFSA